jgi:hypothetical protein
VIGHEGAVSRRTHYQLLGVSPHASHAEIRRAYHRLARVNHPDAHPSAEPDVATRSRRAMAEINAAWEVLGDPEKRRAYDWAIGTTPRPAPRASADDGPAAEDGLEGFAGLDDWDDPPRRQRPADALVIVPVLLLVAVIVTFAFSAMSQSTALRTASLVLAPVTAGSFVAAPLFAMLRSRSRGR